MLISRISAIFNIYTKEEKRLVAAIRMIVGSKPFNLRLYQIAIRHTSVAHLTKRGIKESNERLEYLGDAVLNLVVADYLFKRFPFRDEGFLTELRSRIVSRDSLNNVAGIIGLPEIICFDQTRKMPNSHKSIYGNALEALTGAIYIDRGFRFTERFIVEKLLSPHFDMQELIHTTKNYKSKLIEWAQKHKKTPVFEHIKTIDKEHYKEFVIQVCIDEEPVAKGHGLNKKNAAQNAAREACIILKLV